MRTRLIVLGIAATLAVAFGVVGCDSDPERRDGRPSSGTETEKIEQSVKALVNALEVRDEGRVAELLSDALRDGEVGEEFEALIDCIPSGASIQALGADVTAFGEDASANLTLRVTQDGLSTELEWRWDFQRQEDGTWGLVAFPDCPF